MKRRLFFGFALVVFLWNAAFAALVSGADEERPGGTTGAVFVTNKYIWVGDVTRYGQVAVEYHIDVLAQGVAWARWECTSANGPTDQFSGGVGGHSWDVDDSWNGSAKVLSSTDTYCAYHVWATTQAFRITTSTVYFWNQEFEGGSGTNPTPAPGSTAGPGTSVSGASPTPTPTPAPCTTGEREVIIDGTPTDYTYRVITYCPEDTGNIVDRQWVGGVGCVDQFTTGRAWGGSYTFTAAAGETTAYTAAHIESASPMSPSGTGSHTFTIHDMASGGWDGFQLTATTDTPHAADLLGGTHTNFDVWFQGRALTAGHSYNLRSDGDTCDAGPGVGTFQIESGEIEIWLGPSFPSSPGQPWEGDDITPDPSPTPSASPSATPSPTPPPPPPPGYFLPMPDSPSPGPNLGGSEGLVPPEPQPPNPTGMAECDDDDGTYSKPGQAPLQPLNDTSFPGSINPLDYVPWVGNMLANVPIVVSNIGQWHVNTGVDFVVPGPCITTLIEDGQTALMEKAPFSLFTDAQELVAAGVAGAGTGSEPSMTFAGTTVSADFSAIAENVAPFRGFMGAAVWLLGIIGILRLVAGTLGVSNGGGQS